MSYRIKVPPKTLAVDEAHLLSGMDHLSLSLQRHRLVLLSGMVVVLLAAAIIGTVLWWDARQAEQAYELYHQGLVLYTDRPVDQPAKAEENLKRAIQLFTQVVDQYPRTPSAELALFELGNALTDKSDLPAAIGAYQRFIAGYGSNKALLGMVYQRLAYAQLLKGDTDQAIKTFAAVLDVPGALNGDQALFELGKIEETQGRPEGALARYQELMKQYPNSPFASEAAVRIKAMEAKKSPDVPAPSLAPHPPGTMPPGAAPSPSK